MSHPQRYMHALLPSPTGAVDMAELKGHPFFEGLVWEGLRSSEAPAFTPPPADTMDMEGLDWELNSLLAQQPLVYE